MRAAICLRGVYFFQGKYDWYTNYKDTIDYLKQNVILALNNDGYKVDIFISTYDMDNLEQLKLDYNPVKIDLGIFDITEEHYDVTFRHLNTLFNSVKQYEIENNITYDFIIQTRFDLKFMWPINTAPEGYDVVDYNKFNISYKQIHGDSDDCFWGFHRKYLDEILCGINILQKNNSTTHKIQKLISEPIHFLAPIDIFSKNQNIELTRTFRNNIFFKERN
jgi:hypothetical protein